MCTQEQLESEVVLREKQVSELESLASESQVGVAEGVASLQEREKEVERLGREVEEERGRRERLEKDLAAAAGNKEEMKRVLSEEVSLC